MYNYFGGNTLGQGESLRGSRAACRKERLYVAPGQLTFDNSCSSYQYCPNFFYIFHEEEPFNKKLATKPMVEFAVVQTLLNFNVEYVESDVYRNLCIPFTDKRKIKFF